MESGSKHMPVEQKASMKQYFKLKFYQEDRDPDVYISKVRIKKIHELESDSVSFLKGQR